MVEVVLKERIRELRKAKGITQEALAREVGVSETTISKWENGNSVPDIEMLCILSDYVEVSLDELLDRKTELKRKVSEWKTGNTEKPAFSEKTDLLEDISGADDLLIQLVLRRLELADVVLIMQGSAYPVCERIFANLSLKIAGLVIDSLEKSKPEETEIIRAEKKFLEAAEEIRRRVGK